MVIAIDFMLVDTMFESNLYLYLNTGNGFCYVIVTATDFILVDIMCESQLNGY